MLIGTHLLQRIQYKSGMTTVFPAIEPLRADEAGDGMDLPIYNINIGGAQSFGATGTRPGLRPKIAKRFVDESSYPWITRSHRPVATSTSRGRAKDRQAILPSAVFLTLLQNRASSLAGEVVLTRPTRYSKLIVSTGGFQASTLR